MPVRAGASGGKGGEDPPPLSDLRAYALGIAKMLARRKTALAA